jgi:cysteine synthase
MTAVVRPNVVERIGQTPLVELKSFSTKNVKFFAKLEWHNPFGSVKDRAAYWMTKDAQKHGILKKDKSIIIEPTSGNTGIALTGIASALGYKVEESSMPDFFKRREKVVDEWMTATHTDSFDAVRKLVEKEAMLVGPSSGSVMTSMLKMVQNLDRGIIVGIFADDGRKFRSPLHH